MLEHVILLHSRRSSSYETLLQMIMYKYEGKRRINTIIYYIQLNTIFKKYVCFGFMIKQFKHCLIVHSKIQFPDESKNSISRN